MGDLAGGFVLDLGLEVINPLGNIFEAPKNVEKGASFFFQLGNHVEKTVVDANADFARGWSHDPEVKLCATGGIGNNGNFKGVFVHGKRSCG